MNDLLPYSIRVVLDRSFGERLSALPAGKPVWLIKSPINTPVAQRLWTERPAKDHLTGITTFEASVSEIPEETFLSIVDTIDLHHGEFSSGSPYYVLLVIGCTVTPEIRLALEERGFRIAAENSDGFSAIRSEPDC